MSPQAQRKRRNQMTITAIAKQISVIGGAALVAWQLGSQTNQAIMAHLDNSFASKSDVARLEKKIDSLADTLSKVQPHSQKR